MLKSEIKKAAQVLRSGGLVIFPTETVYGLGAALSQKEAIKKIYELKKRPLDKPLQILIADKKQLPELVKNISPKGQELIDKYWPGPLTLVFEKADGQGTIGIRMPDNEIALELIREIEEPLAATSANLSGEPAPYEGEKSIFRLHNEIYLLDGGPSRLKTSSTVVDVTVDPPKVLRKGTIDPLK